VPNDLLGWQSRYIELITRLTGLEGRPDLVPPGLVLEDASNHDELAFLKRERICFAAVGVQPAVGVSSGLVITPAANTLTIVTAISVSKATAGFVQILLSDANEFTNLVASFGFFRDTRSGLLAVARPSTLVSVHSTAGGLPVSPGYRRVGVAANITTFVPISPIVLKGTVGIINVNAVRLGVFNETLNEQLDVGVDWYERGVEPEELVL